MTDKTIIDLKRETENIQEEQIKEEIRKNGEENKIKNDTIDENVITKFLKRVNLDRLIGNLNNELKFILAAEHIDYGDKRKLKDVIFTKSF